jgi:hypothetical protein
LSNIAVASLTLSLTACGGGNSISTGPVTTNAQASTGSLGQHAFSGPLHYDVLEAAGPFTPTTSIQLTGLVNTPGTYNLTTLASLLQSQVTITSGATTSVYGGVLMTDLLNSAVLTLNPAEKNDQLTKSVQSAPTATPASSRPARSIRSSAI